MPDEPQNGNRYQVPAGNVEAQFVNEAQTVLLNKRGLVTLDELQLAEEEALARAYEQLLSEVRVDTPLTTELVRYIHQTIFGDLFAWAGRWRTVQISKPGAIWPPPHYLDQAMADFESRILQKLPAASLQDDATFCAAVGEIQGEFLAIHPFREGNARTIKLLTNLLAAQTNRPLLVYDSSPQASQAYIHAAKAALNRKDYGPLTTMASQALQRAQQS